MAPCPTFEIGPFSPADADAPGIIVFNAVHDSAAAFHRIAQRQARAPAAPAGPAWVSRLTAERTFVARQRDVSLGVMPPDEDGYIDLASVAPRISEKA